MVETEPRSLGGFCLIIDDDHDDDPIRDEEDENKGFHNLQRRT